MYLYIYIYLCLARSRKSRDKKGFNYLKEKRENWIFSRFNCVWIHQAEISVKLRIVVEWESFQRGNPKSRRMKESEKKGKGIRRDI